MDRPVNMTSTERTQRAVKTNLIHSLSLGNDVFSCINNECWPYTHKQKRGLTVSERVNNHCVRFRACSLVCGVESGGGCDTCNRQSGNSRRVTYSAMSTDRIRAKVCTSSSLLDTTSLTRFLNLPPVS